MKAPFLNLHEWIRRLGCKYTGEPSAPVGEIVQPVALVGDHSRLVAPLRPPSAMLGFQMATAGANNYIWRLQCMAPGGLWCPHWWLTGGTAVTQWTLYLEPLIAGSLFFPPPAPPADPYILTVNRTARAQPMWPAPPATAVKSTLLGGESYASPAINVNLHPTVRLVANARAVFEAFYLPAGSALVGELDTPNPNLASVGFVIEECPAPTAPIE